MRSSCARAAGRSIGQAMAARNSSALISASASDMPSTPRPPGDAERGDPRNLLHRLEAGAGRRSRPRRRPAAMSGQRGDADGDAARYGFAAASAWRRARGRPAAGGGCRGSARVRLPGSGSRRRGRSPRRGSRSNDVTGRSAAGEGRPPPSPSVVRSLPGSGRRQPRRCGSCSAPSPRSAERRAPRRLCRHGWHRGSCRRCRGRQQHSWRERPRGPLSRRRAGSRRARHRRTGPPRLPSPATDVRPRRRSAGAGPAIRRR